MKNQIQTILMVSYFLEAETKVVLNIFVYAAINSPEHLGRCRPIGCNDEIVKSCKHW